MMKQSPSTRYFGERRKQKWKRILIPLVLVISIITATLMLGNLFKDRLDAAEPLLALHVFTFPEQDGSVRTPSELLLHRPGITVSLSYAAVDPSVSKAEDLDTLTDVYTGISLSVSPERTESETAALRHIASGASLRGIQCCAVIPVREVVSADVDASLATACALAQDLSKMGFTEMLITGITGEESAVALAEIPGSIRQSTPGIRIGFGVTAEALESGYFAPALEVMAETADFMALDPASVTETEQAVQNAFLHRGSIGYFSMRILIRGDASTRAATEAALRLEGYVSLQSVP